MGSVPTDSSQGLRPTDPEGSPRLKVTVLVLRPVLSPSFPMTSSSRLVVHLGYRTQTVGSDPTLPSLVTRWTG